MENLTDHTSPVAAHVIEKCGGVARVAEICGKSRSAIHKWTYPKNREGRGGVVPQEDAQKLLDAAARFGFELSAEDFFEPLPKGAGS